MNFSPELAELLGWKIEPARLADLASLFAVIVPDVEEMRGVSLNDVGPAFRFEAFWE